MAHDIAADPEWLDLPDDWHEKAEAVTPATKKLITLRLDDEVIDRLRQGGAGYQTRINAALLAFKRHKAKPSNGP